MAFGLLGIWIGGLAILLSGFFYTRAMLASLRAAKAEAAQSASRAHKSQREVRSSGRVPAERVMVIRSSSSWGRRFFYLAMGGALVAAATLWVMILGRHYEVEYVWKVTDNALPLRFRIASFWAEQEGTFLLWLLYGFILATVLLRRIGSKTEPYVMPFICAVQLFLFLMLTVMSPFRVIPMRPEDLHLTGWAAFMQTLGLRHLAGVPPDGQGLNILLQNLWMTIHPPIMFMGFSSTLIPCVLAVGALVRRDWDGWARQALPWAVYAFMFLGFGLFLGGYWAYETLGWGGYWAWDPVENSSFVPWLLTGALVHGLQVQQARGSWKQVNLLLAITAFLAFFYGTFLTRSGALNEFSVHSFVSPGGMAMGLLLGFLLLFTVGFWGLWLARMGRIQSEPTYEQLNERPFGFFLGIILFLGAAVIVLIGMSWPIISREFAGKAASINYQFYNRALLPVGAFVAMLMAVTPLMAWRRRQEGPWNPSPLLRFALFCVALILLGCIPALYYAWRGNNAPALFLFTTSVSLALITNTTMLVKTARQGILQTGAWAMHVGFCLALIGIISTSVYSKDQRVILEKGQTQRVYGYDLTYTGFEPQPDGRDVLGMDVTTGTDRIHARPHSFTHGSERYNTPYIVKFWDHDLYIAPSGHFDGSGQLQLKKGQTDQVAGQTVRFDRFVTNGGRPGADGRIDIGVNLSIMEGTRQRTIQPHFMVAPSGEAITPPVELPGGAGVIRVAKVTPNLAQPEESTVLLDVKPSQPVDVAGFDVSTKPYVNVLWLGGYMMFLGGILAWRRRAAITARAADKEQEPQASGEECGTQPSIRPRRRTGLRPEPASAKTVSSG
jgi:cytochrome c-type biogenesis protein CcmF